MVFTAKRIRLGYTVIVGTLIGIIISNVHSMGWRRAFGLPDVWVAIPLECPNNKTTRFTWYAMSSTDIATEPVGDMSIYALNWPVVSKILEQYPTAKACIELPVSGTISSGRWVVSGIEITRRNNFWVLEDTPVKLIGLPTTQADISGGGLTVFKGF